MVRKPVKPADSDANLSRRDLLRAATLVAGGLVLPIRGFAQSSQPAPATSRPATHPTRRPTSRPTSQPEAGPWWMQPPWKISRVVEVQSRVFEAGSFVAPVQAAEMINLGIQILTGESTPKESWKRILQDAKRIGIKLNSVGDDALQINEGVAHAVVMSLGDAGYTPDAITLIEAPPGVASSLGTPVPASGWGIEIPVGDTTDQLAQYLFDVDAIINVPLLKTHQLAGMSGAMKNLSHALLRHPARFHANGCSPYVGNVIGHDAVSRKLRLNIVNAFRIVARNGPEANGRDILNVGTLLLGFDPVAVDSVGYALLLRERRRLGLTEPFDVPYLKAANADDVGRQEAHLVERIPLTHGG